MGIKAAGVHLVNVAIKNIICNRVKNMISCTWVDALNSVCGEYCTDDKNMVMSNAAYDQRLDKSYWKTFLFKIPIRSLKRN